MPSFSPSRLKKQNFCFYGLQKNLCTNFCVKSNPNKKKIQSTNQRSSWVCFKEQKGVQQSCDTASFRFVLMRDIT